MHRREPMNPFRSGCPILITATLLAAAAFGQTTATIVGVVTDESGAVIPNCAVKVTNQLTGLSRALITGADGAYIATQLPPGTYSVEAEAAGFRTTVHEGIVLSVQDNAKIDLRLAVGAVTEPVTVVDAAPLVDVRQASIGALMESKRMLELPLSGRTPASLLVRIPTVSNVNAGAPPTSYSVDVNVA